MKAILRSISSDTFNIRTWSPEDAECFALDLLLKIGAEGSDGADNFDLKVCSPSWLAQTSWSFRWGRGLLIVAEYDFAAIEKEISAHVAACQGDTWIDIAVKLSRTLMWEFDDYVE